MENYDELVKELIGSDFLISIAWNAKSPTQAAKMAELIELPKKKVRAIRNAAKIKRDFGEEKFKSIFEPFNVVEVDIKEFKYLKMNIKVTSYYDERGLNRREFEEAKEIIKRAFEGTKYKVSF